MFFYVRAGHRIVAIYPRQLTPGAPLQTSLPGSESGLRQYPCPSCWVRVLQRVLVPVKMPGSSLPTSAALRADSLHASHRNGTYCSGRASTEETPQRRQHKSTRRAARPAPAPRVSPGGGLTSGRERAHITYSRRELGFTPHLHFPPPMSVRMCGGEVYGSASSQ